MYSKALTERLRNLTIRFKLEKRSMKNKLLKSLNQRSWLPQNLMNRTLQNRRDSPYQNHRKMKRSATGNKL